MEDQEFIRNIETDTAKLRVKKAINEAKKACGELDKEDGIKCYSELKKAEDNIDDGIRENKARKAIETMKERQQGYDFEANNVDDLIQ